MNNSSSKEAERVISYLVNRKISRNMTLINMYGDKSQYPKFPTNKLFAQNDYMRRVKKLYYNGIITFDEAVKHIANNSIDGSYYDKF